MDWPKCDKTVGILQKCVLIEMTQANWVSWGLLNRWYLSIIKIIKVDKNNIGMDLVEHSISYQRLHNWHFSEYFIVIVSTGLQLVPISQTQILNKWVKFYLWLKAYMVLSAHLIKLNRSNLQVLQYKLDNTVLLFLVAVLEYVVADIWFIVGRFVLKISHQTISQEDVRIALIADQVGQHFILISVWFIW